ncbi:hypothetical protein [Streptomyces natalensis]|uniref:hypothetical protein n=1 Tax=Streptomyces natalensis TaxID=68242 RepID=UPI0018E389BC|nr:hypothetical protein [Streptomyces natalensis]
MTRLEFARSVGRPLWTADPEDADRFLCGQRKLGLAGNTVYGKAGRIGRFFDFVQLRYQGDVLALTGYAVQQPIDEFNRPAKPDYGEERLPPSASEVVHLFTCWGGLPPQRTQVPAGGAELHGRLAVAAYRVEDQRVADARSARLAAGPG